MMCGYSSLPSGWDVDEDVDGKLYFIDHNTRTTTWLDPRHGYSKSKFFMNCEPGEFPLGWEQSYDENFGVHYVNHITKTTQYEDPRKELWRLKEEQMLNEYVNCARFCSTSRGDLSVCENLYSSPELDDYKRCSRSYLSCDVDDTTSSLVSDHSGEHHVINSSQTSSLLSRRFSRSSFSSSSNQYDSADTMSCRVGNSNTSQSSGIDTSDGFSSLHLASQYSAQVSNGDWKNLCVCQHFISTKKRIIRLYDQIRCLENNFVSDQSESDKTRLLKIRDKELTLQNLKQNLAEQNLTAEQKCVLHSRIKVVEEDLCDVIKSMKRLITERLNFYDRRRLLVKDLERSVDLLSLLHVSAVGCKCALLSPPACLCTAVTHPTPHIACSQTQSSHSRQLAADPLHPPKSSPPSSSSQQFSARLASICPTARGGRAEEGHVTAPLCTCQLCTRFVYDSTTSRLTVDLIQARNVTDLTRLTANALIYLTVHLSTSAAVSLTECDTPTFVTSACRQSACVFDEHVTVYVTRETLAACRAIVCVRAISPQTPPHHAVLGYVSIDVRSALLSPRPKWHCVIPCISECTGSDVILANDLSRQLAASHISAPSVKRANTFSTTIHQNYNQHEEEKIQISRSGSESALPNAEIVNFQRNSIIRRHVKKGRKLNDVDQSPTCFHSLNSFNTFIERFHSILNMERQSLRDISAELNQLQILCSNLKRARNEKTNSLRRLRYASMLQSLDNVGSLKSRSSSKSFETCRPVSWEPTYKHADSTRSVSVRARSHVDLPRYSWNCCPHGCDLSSCCCADSHKLSVVT